MEHTLVNIAEKNAEIVRRGYEAFNAGDMKTLTELFHPNATWHTPGKSPIAGLYKGRESTFSQFGRYSTDTKGTFKATLKDLAMCDDGKIVGIHRNTAERNGKKLDTDCCIIFELKDGKLMSGKEYFFDQYAWDTFWA